MRVICLLCVLFSGLDGGRKANTNRRKTIHDRIRNQDQLQIGAGTVDTNSTAVSMMNSTALGTLVGNITKDDKYNRKRRPCMLTKSCLNSTGKGDRKIQTSDTVVLEKSATCRSYYRKQKKVPASKVEKLELSSYHTCNFAGSQRERDVTCHLPQALLCDGVSSCLDDECGCHGEDVFYCADGEGCVALKQVCDGIADCTDQSDECICENYLNCESERVFPSCRSAANRAQQCSGSQTELYAVTEENTSADHGLFNCLKKRWTKLAKVAGKLELNVPVKGRKLPGNKQRTSKECMKECSPLENHCSYVDWKNMTLTVEGESGSENRSLKVLLNYSCGDGTTIPLSADMDACDGYDDCPNSADEAFCASRFYCADGSQNLPRSVVCDGVPDCEDLSDECQQCARSNLADEKYMISNKYLNYYMVVLCVMVVVLNLRGLYGHGARLYYVRRNNARVDSLLCIQLCVYDLLMGIYVLIITSKHFQYYGSYCLEDASWRSSGACNFSGFLFTLSSHGSLMTVLIMGAIRCYSCENMLVYFSLRRFFIGLTVANVLNVIASAVILSPSEYMENMFVTTVLFRDNRVMKKGTKQLVDSLLHEYYGDNITTPLPGWSTRFKLLSNITSNPELFLPTLKFGFFNQSPLCIQNLFSDDPDKDLLLLKMLYISFLAVTIVSFSVCYIWIVFVRYKSSVPTDNPAFRRSAVRDNKKLSWKVSLIITSQLLAWIPIIIATILTISGKTVPPDFYEMAAIVLIPANSLLNPIFHFNRRGPEKRDAKKAVQGTVVTRLGTQTEHHGGRPVLSPDQAFTRTFCYETSTPRGRSPRTSTTTSTPHEGSASVTPRSDRTSSSRSRKMQNDESESDSEERSVDIPPQLEEEQSDGGECRKEEVESPGLVTLVGIDFK